MSPHTDAGALLKLAEDAFEFIRLKLIGDLEEPQRTAFWKAVEMRDKLRQAASQGSAGGEHDPADVWENYIGEVDPEHRSLQGALAFGFAAAISPPVKTERKLCSCKASDRDGQHMAWCSSLKPPVKIGGEAETTGARANDPGCCMGLAPEEDCDCVQSARPVDAGAREEIDGILSIMQGRQAIGSDLHVIRTDAIAAILAVPKLTAAGETACCKGLAPSRECRCEIERKAAGHPPYQRSEGAAQAPSKEETFCHWLKGYLGAIKGRDELDAREANVVRNKLNEMLDGTSPSPSAPAQIVGVCDCGFSAEVCRTNPCMRKKMATSGLNPEAKYPDCGNPSVPSAHREAGK